MRSRQEIRARLTANARRLGPGGGGAVYAVLYKGLFTVKDQKESPFNLADFSALFQ
jgi:hypothetical protein